MSVYSMTGYASGQQAVVKAVLATGTPTIVVNGEVQDLQKLPAPDSFATLFQ